MDYLALPIHVLKPYNVNMPSKGGDNVSRGTFHVQHNINLKIGRIGEEIASRYLTKKLHRIIGRNRHQGALEFDILTRFHGKHFLYEVKTVAREKIGKDEISREMSGLAGRYSLRKSRNMNIGAQVFAIDGIRILCVALSLQDGCSYVHEMESF